MFREYREKQRKLISQFSETELLESRQWFFENDFGHSYHGDIRSLLINFCNFEHESERKDTLKYCLDHGYLSTSIGEFKFLPNRTIEYSALIEHKHHEKM